MNQIYPCSRRKKGGHNKRNQKTQKTKALPGFLCFYCKMLTKPVVFNVFLCFCLKNLVKPVVFHVFLVFHKSRIQEGLEALSTSLSHVCSLSVSLSLSFFLSLSISINLSLYISRALLFSVHCFFISEREREREREKGGHR